MMKQKGLSLKSTTALLIIVIVLGIGGTMWYYALYKVVYVEEYDIEFKTSEQNHIGYNVDPTLHYGMIPMTGGTAEKKIELENDWEIPLMVQIRLKGEAADYASVSDNNFIMEPLSHKRVSLYITVPPDHGELGIYTGMAKVIYMRP